MIVGSLFQTTSPLAYIPMIVSRLKPFDPSQLNSDVWFDPSDASTVFVDRTGTVPATAGDPVGQIKDKSGKGNHAVAPTDAARPTLARMPKTGRRNILEYTEDFSNAYWQLFGGGVKEAGNRLVSTGQARSRTQSSVITRTFPVGTNANFSVDVYPDVGLSEIYMQIRQNNEAGIAGLPTAQRFAFASLVNTAGVSEKLDGNGWRLFVNGTSTVEVGTIRFGVGLGDATNAVPNGMGARVTRFQATFSLEATQYQKVTNAFDVTEAGVPDVWSLEFDGVDDILQTSAISGWKATGASFSCAMQSDVVASGKSSAGMVFGLSVSGFATYYTLSLRPNQPLASHAVTYRVGGGALTQASLNGILNKTLPFAVTAITDLTSIKAFVNGELKSQSPTPAAGTIDAPVIIGSTEQPCKFYGGLMIKRALQETEVKLLSKYLVDKAGVTL